MEYQALKEIPTDWNMRHQEEEGDIDLVELFYLIWGNLWKIILCLFAGAVFAFGITWFFITPMFEATSSIYIVSASNNSVVNLTDLQIGAQLTADYQELMLSRPLLEDVIQNLDLKDSSGEKALTVKALREMVSITNASDTRILEMTEEPNLVESAIPPTEKASPSYAVNTLIGGVLGAFLCSGILIVRYLLNDTFMTPDDVTKAFGVQPLATIPESKGDEYGQDSKKRHKRSNNRKDAQ